MAGNMPIMGYGTVILVYVARKARGSIAWGTGFALPILYGTPYPESTSVLPALGHIAEKIVLALAVAGMTWAILGAAGTAAQPFLAQMFEHRMRKATRQNTLPALWAIPQVREDAKKLRRAPELPIPRDTGSIVELTARHFARTADVRLIGIIEKRSRELGIECQCGRRAHTWSGTVRSMAWVEENLPDPHAHHQWLRYLDALGDRAWAERRVMSEKLVRDAVVPGLGVGSARLVVAARLLERSGRARHARSPAQARKRRRQARRTAGGLLASLGELTVPEIVAITPLIERDDLPLEALARLVTAMAKLPKARKDAVVALSGGWKGDAQDLLNIVEVIS